MAPELPGFYFDTEKQKYFRIQKNQNSTGAAYTQQRIDNLQAEAISAAHREKRQQNIRNGRILRGYNELELDVNLRIRTGQRRPQQVIQDYYAQNLQPKLFNISQWNGRLGGTELTGIALSKGRVVVTHYDYDLTIASVSCLYPRQRLCVGLRPWWVPHSVALAGQNGECLVSGKGSYVDVARFLDSHARQLYSLHSGVEINDLACGADGSELNIAIATTEGLKVLKEDRLVAASEKRASKEQMVVSFQNDERIIMTGTRGGDIWFTDVRSDLGSSVNRIRHIRKRSGVTGICETRNTNQIIVSSLHGARLYDLRFVPKPQWKKSNDTAGWGSPSLVDFQVGVGESRYNVQYGPGKALAYVKELDVAVILTHCTGLVESHPQAKRISNRLSVYQVSSGRKLHMPRLEGLDMSRGRGVVAGRVHDGPPSIFLAAEGKVFELGLDAEDEEGVEAESGLSGRGAIQAASAVQSEMVKVWETNDFKSPYLS